MHEQARAWVAKHADRSAVSVLDIGGRDVGGPWGGSVRDLFPNATQYLVLDIEPGPDVDIVADAATWDVDREFDAVVAVECFEHAPRWAWICGKAIQALRPGGRFITTMAGPGRPAHGALGADLPGPDEYYHNVDPAELFDVLDYYGFIDILVDSRPSPADTRAVAYRPIRERDTP